MSDYEPKYIWGKLFIKFIDGEITSEAFQKLTASNQIEIDFDNLVLLKGEK